MSQQVTTFSISAPGFMGLNEPLLKCGCCRQLKETKFFDKATKKKRGYATYCKQCKLDKRNEKRKLLGEEEYANLFRKYYLKCAHGLSKEQYNSLLIKQNHKCAICGCDETEAFGGRLHIDHCHSTGKVRGLLCLLCNTGIGKLKDSVEILQKAIDYLRK